MRVAEGRNEIQEVYFSVDVEADGPIPGPYSMSSIGVVACAVRLKDGSIVDIDMDDGRTYSMQNFNQSRINSTPKPQRFLG